jgi:hypothetical protein
MKRAKSSTVDLQQDRQQQSYSRQDVTCTAENTERKMLPDIVVADELASCLRGSDPAKSGAAGAGNQACQCHRVVALRLHHVHTLTSPRMWAHLEVYNVVL